MKINPPLPSEYHPLAQGYVQSVGDSDVIDLLHTQIASYTALIGSLTTEQLEFAYAPAKWAVIEVIGHIADVERVMSYRLLRFSRGDKTVLPGFEENDYVKNAHFKPEDKDSLLREFEMLRRANLEMISRLTDDQLMLSGMSNGRDWSVRALIYVLAGHLKHHMGILVERYKL
tara:strand:- start:195 stop:713 length:519 start_codon:yes stop_codon:yes gene_type:complete